ncbi:MAG: hypothetical protein AB1705_08595 [Verrucomicrobiota bacterium]
MQLVHELARQGVGESDAGCAAGGYGAIDSSSIIGLTSKLTSQACAVTLKVLNMTAIAKELDERLTHWAPEKAEQVSRLVAEIIQLADANALDLTRSRAVEQEVLNILDEPPAR